MAYNSWKMLDKIDVAVRTGGNNYRGFSGYIVEHGDKDALENAKGWARTQTWDAVKHEHITTNEPKIYTFDNEGFTATILDSAGGSSQGGRLSFWMCEIEKDGVKFRIGVNDAVLADLIKHSDIKNGVVQQKVMFARKSGQPGLIHEGMESYKEAVADMKQKANLKTAKKTSKWEIGGVYSTLTQIDICIGEVWDTYEEVIEETAEGWSRRYSSTKLVKRDKPVKVLAWTHFYNFNKDKELPTTFEQLLKDETKDREHVYFSTGKPPARAKTGQLEVKDSDMELLDKLLSLRQDSVNYNDPKIYGRYVRKI